MAADNIDTLIVETASCKIIEDDEDSGDYLSDRSFLDMPVEVIHFNVLYYLICK